MYKSDWQTFIIHSVSWLIIILSLWYLLSINPSTDEIWNDGICEKCDKRFVVTKARGSINWYACPDCDQEVKRLVW